MALRGRTAARCAAVLAGVGLAAFALAQATGIKLIVNGNVASTSVRIIDGRAYAPIDDIARAMNMEVTKRTGAYEIAPAGGANQVEGLRGKVGDMLFDGKWRVKVIDIQRVPQYTIRRDGGIDWGRAGNKVEGQPDGKTYKAAAGYTLVIANLLVKNGQKATEAFGSYYGQHTALADMDGSSYPPIGWDQEGGMITTKQLLPGAGQETAAIFLVPENAKLKDLVITLTNISDNHPSDVRVSLGD